MIQRKRGRPPKVRPPLTHTAVEITADGRLRFVTHPGPKPKRLGRPKAPASWEQLLQDVGPSAGIAAGLRDLASATVLEQLDAALADGRLMQRWRASDRLFAIGDAVLALHRQGLPLRSNSRGDGALVAAARAMHCSEATAQRSYRYRLRFSTELDR